MIILYADDTVILADSIESLQNSLDILADYCNEWALSVNSSKTKVCIFSLRKMNPSNIEIAFKGIKLEIVSSFTYLGLVLN